MPRIDAAAIHDSLSPHVTARLDQIEFFAEIDSTNSHLMREMPPAPGRVRIAIADHQTAGRGRQNREWISAPGSSLCLSLAYTFVTTPEALSGVTLALGVAVADGLREIGAEGVHLKWPNDVVARDGKLGGMLAESQLRGASATVIAGIGINVNLPVGLIRDTASRWAQRAIDLRSILPEPITRNMLAAVLVDSIVDAMLTYEVRGFAAFEDAWRRYDWLRGRRITVEQEQGRISGIASGVDSEGALLVENAGEAQRILTGSILLDGHAPP